MERVERGAAWLDEHEPGWELKIDLGELNLASCYKCILGQVYGRYENGLKVLARDLLESSIYAERVDVMEENLGFDIGFDEPIIYADLGKSWTSLIKERLDRGIQI